jgi:hypothetical protein
MPINFIDVCTYLAKFSLLWILKISDKIKSTILLLEILIHISNNTFKLKPYKHQICFNQRMKTLIYKLTLKKWMCKLQICVLKNAIEKYMDKYLKVFIFDK